MIKKIATTIWNISEFLHISLGKLAPIIFGYMIGCKGKRIDNKQER